LRARDEAEKEIPKEFRVSIHLYSHALILIPRLLIATTLLTRASAGRRAGERGGCFKMRQECARGRQGGRRLPRDTAKVTEAAIMKGELITPSRQCCYRQRAQRDGDSVFRAAQHPCWSCLCKCTLGIPRVRTSHRGRQKCNTRDASPKYRGFIGGGLFLGGNNARRGASSPATFPSDIYDRRY